MAFDLGTHCGIAWGDHHGVYHDALDLSESGRFSDTAFAHFRAFVAGLVQKHAPIIVFIEKPHAGQFFHATRILFGLMGVLESVLQRHGILYKYYSPATVKKFWTGSGRATKPQMLAATASYGYEGVKDHNVSDAIALLEYGMSQEID